MATNGRDPEDLTGRARIRDAAMRLFGELGFERTTIRGIAEAAGVSSGLVRHHFGSKQELREVCDAHLVKVVRRLNAEARAAGGTMNPVAAMGPYQRYLARALAEGWAAPLFDEMVEMGARWLADADRRRPDPPDVDPRARAAVIAAMALGVGVLHRHVSRGLGVDVSSPEGERLLYRALIDIYSHPVLTPEEAASAREALDKATQADREAREEHHDD
ncbi:TetR/AcrR family transcriptional regulator [Sphaerisporangium viridialbum]|uniref:TetR/AcrR family transcriptional regulator n=1 Tax=Sphaerisporangium viridialbum TaxID=46189 RepID=UPI003C7471E3